MMLLRGTLIVICALLHSGCVSQSASVANQPAAAGNHQAGLHLPAPEMMDQSQKKGIPLVFAKMHQVNVNLQNGGIWRTEGNRLIWELGVSAGAASSFNFAFRDVRMSQSATLEILDETGAATGGVYTDKDNKLHGQLWTGQVNGKSVLIRFSVLAAEKAENNLVLWRVNQGMEH